MRKGISGKRLARIEEHVAPLFARGLTQREIANKLGMSLSIIQKDCALIETTWSEQIPERLESARGELVAKHDEIYKIAMDGYFESKNTRMLEIATKQLEILGRLLGQAGPSINLHAHQHNVAIAADAVVDLFRPLAADDYAAMVAAKALPPAEATELPTIDLEAEPGNDDWTGSAGLGSSGADAPENQEPGAPQNRRVGHPLRG